MIILEILGVLAVGAAAVQIGLIVRRSLGRAAQEAEQRRLTLDLLNERVLAARLTRQAEEERQSLSWSGYRKFVVAKKVPEDAGGASLPSESERTEKPRLARRDDPAIYAIDGDETVLGRGKDCEVRLESSMVSSRHARIFRKGKEWFIEDLGSSNGTFVNMVRVKDEPVRLHPNDHIRVAALDFEIHLPRTDAAPRTPQVCSFHLSPHDDKPLPPFLPGQYLTFQLRIPGVAKPTIRCYSLSDCANPDGYRVTIKRVPRPRDRNDLPDGLASNFFHDGVKEGDILDVQAPRGGFGLDLAKEYPLVLIGAGIGVTPVLSMLNALVASGSKREVWFFYGVRNGVEHCMRERFERVAREHENVRMHVCYSDPTADDVEGRDYRHAERVTVDLLQRLLPSSNYEFYVCGPPPMMSQMVEDLHAWGVPEASVHFEAFGPASVKKVTPKVSEVEATGAASRKVSFARSGKVAAWGLTSTSLLELAEAEGVRIDSGCRAGNCGTCVTAVRSGTFSHTVPPGAPVGPGTCLTCISVPKSDLVLDA